ncbi:kinase-like domain-containing protein, partial [Rhizophagus irregularis DAOM 181602=DAOM 197198]
MLKMQVIVGLKRIQITFNIIYALDDIHVEGAIHRDLHSGNILYEKREQNWYISDFGFCGPADKSLKSIYGNLPYIAPEVIAGKQATKSSDIYSFAMLMWEISSGQPPFLNCKHDYDLILNIINGIRPRIVSGTPLEYESLMKQCWDADPLKRPMLIYTFFVAFYSKYSKSYDDFQIPDNIDDFNKSSNWKNNSTSKMSSIFKANSKDAQNDYEIETMQQQIKNINLE